MSSSGRSKQRTFVFILASFVFLFTLTFGAVIGYYLSIKSVRQKVAGRQTSHYMGTFLSEAQKPGVAQAYKNKDKALKEFDRYAWDIPTIPVPFVGSASKPGDYKSAKINSLGLRSYKELLIPKPPNTFRIFFTGGSTALSVGAPSENDTIAGTLESLLNAQSSEKTYEVFTMASSAWASTQERIMIENRLSTWEPDLVISFSGNNDVHWGHVGDDVMWFRTMSDLYFWWMTNKAFRAAGFGRLPKGVKKATHPVNPKDVTKRLIKNIRLSAEAVSVPYVFVLQPTLSVSKKELSLHEAANLTGFSEEKIAYFRKCYELIRRELQKLNLEEFRFVDSTRVFDDYKKDNTIFIDNYHFGDKGNEILARHIFEKINYSLIHDSNN